MGGSKLKAHAVAAGIVGLATLGRRLLDPVLGDELPFITFFPAVALAAWYRGFQPAIGATLLSLISVAFFFIEPRGSLIPVRMRDLVGEVLFIVMAGVVATFGGSLHKARLRSEGESERLGTTLRAIGDAVIVTDAQGRIDFLNPPASRLTGFTLDEARGRPLEEAFRIVNEETRRPAENPAHRALKEGVVVGLANHTVLVRRDGSESAIDDSAAPIMGPEGKPIGVVLVFRDVTERRRAEARLRETEARFRIMADQAPVMIWMCGVDKLFDWFNKPWLEFRGKRLDEELGKGWAEGVHPEDASASLDSFHRNFDGRRPFQMEYRLRRADGEYRWVLDRGTPRFSFGGEFEGFIGSTIDISERRRAEEGLHLLASAGAQLMELEEYEATLQRVARLAVPSLGESCMVFLTGVERRIRLAALAHASPEGERLLRELLERYPIDWSSPSPAVEALKSGQPVVHEEASEEVLRSWARDEDHLRRLRQLGLRSIICAPLSARADTVGVLCVEGPGRRPGKEDLPVVQDLARRAAAALENARLFLELKEADRRKDDFLAMLAHELRNPLAPIRNAVHYMGLVGPDDESQAWARHAVERQVTHLTRLVDDLLDVSRITRGKIRLLKSPLDLGMVVAQAVESTRPWIEGRKHQLTVTLPHEPVLLEADSARLEQVVGNLLQNAAKYTPEGGRIWVVLERTGNRALLRVRDTGVGIEPQMLTRIFDLFTQADSSLDRTGGGLGVGLTLVRSLVEMHGGEVEARSAGPGQGSEFVVRLPIDKLPEARAAAPAPVRRAASPLRILVVDDNVDAADSLCRLLRLGGHEVRVAYQASQALAEASFAPRLVLLDIGLPGMDGYEVARRLREDLRTKNAIFVAVTGYGQEEDRKRALDAGFDRHLVKPVDPATLEGILAAL